jgi:hypothetical protein
VVDAYWAYWLDGAGQRVRLRLNMPNATFTKVQARQFALHEVLGHGLQGASISVAPLPLVLPADSLTPGANRAQEVRWPAVGNRPMSTRSQR